MAICAVWLAAGVCGLGLAGPGFGQTAAASGEVPTSSEPGAAAAGNRAREAAPHALPRVLIALAAVILTGRVLAAGLERLGQPPVIGEVLAGILLGPSLLGWWGQQWGWSASPLLSPEIAPQLGLIAELGVVLYMFLVGMEFNAEMLHLHARAAVAISLASMAVPFLLGAGLAWGLYARMAPAGTDFASFALFMGISLAVTAFPVLARILTDRRMAQTDLGVLALCCAAVGDVAAWWLLAFVAGFVKSQVTSAVPVVLLSLAYVGVMLGVVRPLAVRMVGRLTAEEVTPTTIAVTFAALLVSALTTEWIGIHALFGAFLLGVVIPHDSGLAKKLGSSLEPVVTVLLLPAFFAYTGMRTEIGLVRGWEAWLICGLIIAVASAGKFGGTLAAARLAGLDWRTGSALGILMNTRGLMELIVLNVGLDLGVISPTLFAMLVLMALVTTLATTPLVALIAPQPLPASSAR